MFGTNYTYMFQTRQLDKVLLCVLVIRPQCRSFVVDHTVHRQSQLTYSALIIVLCLRLGYYIWMLLQPISFFIKPKSIVLQSGTALHTAVGVQLMTRLVVEINQMTEVSVHHHSDEAQQIFMTGHASYFHLVVTSTCKFAPVTCVFCLSVGII